MKSLRRGVAITENVTILSTITIHSLVIIRKQHIFLLVDHPMHDEITAQWIPLTREIELVVTVV